MTSFVMIAVACAIAATLAGAAFLVIDRGGDAAAAHGRRVVDTIDRANDLQAETTLQVASRAALTLQAQTGSLAGATPEALATFEPAITFTTDASSGPTVVSVAVGDQAWGAAARSASGSCLWLRLEASGAASYGAGPGCTGTAALGAARSGW